MGVRFTPTKLRLTQLLSTLWLVLSSGFAAAHEVMPTIGDFVVQDGEIHLDLRLNVEAFVAGIDLDGMTDTNDSDLSDLYDSLRALQPPALAPRVRAFLAEWLPRLELHAGDRRIVLTMQRIDIPPVGNPDLPRASHVILTGTLPEGATTLALRWPEGAGDMVLRQQGVEAPFTGYLQGGQDSGPISLASTWADSGWATFGAYLPIGFEQMLPKGLDHILFVLGLFFFSTRPGALIWQVTAFTLAHTLTLALGALGWVNLPDAIVAPLVAVSILYVAVDNLFAQRLTPWRPALIFGFGLLHGLGLASDLVEVGLPPGQVMPALIGFNIGVELAQLTVIALAFLAVGPWFRSKPWYGTRVAMPASVVIAAVGAYWFVEGVFL